MGSSGRPCERHIGRERLPLFSGDATLVGLSIYRGWARGLGHLSDPRDHGPEGGDSRRRRWAAAVRGRATKPGAVEPLAGRQSRFVRGFPEAQQGRSAAMAPCGGGFQGRQTDLLLWALLAFGLVCWCSDIPQLAPEQRGW